MTPAQGTSNRKGLPKIQKKLMSHTKAGKTIENNNQLMSPSVDNLLSVLCSVFGRRERSHLGVGARMSLLLSRRCGVIAGKLSSVWGKGGGNTFHHHHRMGTTTRVATRKQGGGTCLCYVLWGMDLSRGDA